MLRRGLIMLAGLAGFSCGVQADAISDFYTGRQMVITVGYPPGGGYDAVARLLSRHMGKHIPGRPSIIVRNMPGAGGLIATNLLYNISQRDGTEIAILGDTVPFTPLWTKEGVQYDPLRFAYLGSLDRRQAGLVIGWHKASAKTLDDVIREPMTVGSTGTNDITSIAPRVLNAVIGTKFRIIPGYRGISEGALAMERGEIDGWMGWCWPCMKNEKPEWIAGKLVNVLAQFTMERHPELQQTPGVFEFARNDDDRQIMRLVFNSQEMSRLVAAPPGVPAERIAALRKAFEATMKDSEFTGEADRMTIPLSPATPQAVEKLIADAYQTRPELLARAAAIINGK